MCGGKFPFLHMISNINIDLLQNLDNSSVYIKSIIVGFTSILVFSLAGTVINLLGKKKMIGLHKTNFCMFLNPNPIFLAVTMAIIAGTCATCIYFAQNSVTVLALSSIFLAFAGVCGNVLITITLELFPTNLRYLCVLYIKYIICPMIITKF